LISLRLLTQLRRLSSRSTCFLTINFLKNLLKKALF